MCMSRVLAEKEHGAAGCSDTCDIVAMHGVMVMVYFGGIYTFVAREILLAANKEQYDNHCGVNACFIVLMSCS